MGVNVLDRVWGTRLTSGRSGLTGFFSVDAAIVASVVVLLCAATIFGVLAGDTGSSAVI